MGCYIPSHESERAEMLKAMGLKDALELFGDVPPELILKDKLGLPESMSELEVKSVMESAADSNVIFPLILRGAGAYNHYIPSAVKAICSKEDFVTAYTPYQPEISQGVLQTIFEYQTMICELTGMDVSNASVYDGASAAAEAAAMCRDRRRTKTLISGCANPEVIATVKTYCFGSDTELIVVPEKDGVTDLKALEGLLDDETASFYYAYPNFYGLIEDGEAIEKLVHSKGAKLIIGCNPIALGLFKSPGELSADIAVGEGQPLGLPMAYGGPYLGFMAAKKDMMRKLPGRIAGQTKDLDGKRAFVLTLQAREQHIRREKASSNVCTNQTLCAMTAAVYMSLMGPEGMKELARQCYSKAHYFARRLCEIEGIRLRYEGEFFHEFVTTIDMDNKRLLSALEEEGILGGLPVDDGILWCVTELCTKTDLDHVLEIIGEECKNEAGF